MKKRKLKLHLNKQAISKLQDSNMDKIKGGDTTHTLNTTCADTIYPACAISGCWGHQTCFGDPTGNYTTD